MSDITDAALQALSAQAALLIPPEMHATLCQKLDRVLSMIELLQEVPLEGVTPFHHPLPDLAYRPRPDTITEPLCDPAIWALATHTLPPYYTVPAVITEPGASTPTHMEDL